jgi:hypothetical protein
VSRPKQNAISDSYKYNRSCFAPAEISFIGRQKYKEINHFEIIFRNKFLKIGFWGSNFELILGAIVVFRLKMSVLRSACRI